MMFVDSPWPVTTSAPGPSSCDRRQRTRTWPCASSPADTALISYSVSTGCQPRTGWTASSTAANSALTGPLPVAWAALASPATTSDAEPTECPPLDELMFQPRSSIDRGTSAWRSLDERDQVRVGDVLLRVRQGDRRAVDRVERLAVDLVARARAACPGGPRRPDSLPIDSVLPDSPTDCGVMIS